MTASTSRCSYVFKNKSSNFPFYYHNSNHHHHYYHYYYYYYYIFYWTFNLNLIIFFIFIVHWYFILSLNTVFISLNNFLFFIFILVPFLFHLHLHLFFLPRFFLLCFKRVHHVLHLPVLIFSLSLLAFKFFEKNAKTLRTIGEKNSSSFCVCCCVTQGI